MQKGTDGMQQPWTWRGRAAGDRERDPWIGESHNLTILLFGRRTGIWKGFGTRQAWL